MSGAAGCLRGERRGRAARGMCMGMHGYTYAVQVGWLSGDEGPGLRGCLERGRGWEECPRHQPLHHCTPCCTLPAYYSRPTRLRAVTTGVHGTAPGRYGCVTVVTPCRGLGRFGCHSTCHHSCAYSKWLSVRAASPVACVGVVSYVNCNRVYRQR